MRLVKAGASRRTPGVRTPSAFAFWIVRHFAVSQGQPVPTLITGAGQDAILAELLEGHAVDAVGPLDLGPLPTEVLGLAAFRDELRNLFMRAAEFGLDATDLAELGQSQGRPEWVMAAHLLEEYRDVVTLADLPEERGERYDAARVMGEAATLVRNWESLTDAPLPRIDSVVVDDYQEASAALVRLLTALAERGTHLTLVADPDVAVQTFRGARPQFVGRAEASALLGGFGAQRVVLPHVYRGNQTLRTAVSAVVEQVPVAGIVEHRTASLGAAEMSETAAAARRGETALRVRTAASPGAEAALIAHELRQAHMHRGLGWDRMVVIVRAARAASELRRVLRSAHIPLERAETAVVLRDEPAVRMLLAALEAGSDGLTPERAAELLVSDIGQLDDVSIRRLRRDALARIRRNEFPEDFGIDEVIAALLTGTEPATPLHPELQRSIARVSAVIAAARESLSDSDSTPRVALWKIWHATGLAGLWQDRALARGPLGERADADLDAVMALFELAENFEVRAAGAHAREFAAHVRAESLPSDTLAESGVREAGVAVLTVAQAAGREWDFVIVAGVQEGMWPDTRLRDSVLGAGHLADLQLGRIGLGGDARKEVLGDEWRLLASAVSRARQQLLLTAVADEDLRPSAFFEKLAALAADQDALAAAEVRRLDLRGIVSELRMHLDGEQGPTAGFLLGLLAELGVPGAAPEVWAGAAEPSSLGPIFGPDATVFISPSKLESATTCPLRWALESVGGRAAGKIEQSLGSLIHAIAADHPHGTAAELSAALDERFDSLDLPEGWIKESQRAKAAEMVWRLAKYFETVPGTVETEVKLSAPVGGAIISGAVDRLEHVDGGLRVTDLKTGSNPPTKAQAAENAQLAAYQLALDAGGYAGLPPKGARLVYLGTSTNGATTREQQGLEPGGGWARELLETASEVMRGEDFVARVNPMCRHCPVKNSCPARELGRRAAQ